MKWILAGLRSIAEGWASFTLFPSPMPRPKRIRLGSFADDARAMRDDWSNY
jgi:hypothetical protein